MPAYSISMKSVAITTTKDAVTAAKETDSTFSVSVSLKCFACVHLTGTETHHHPPESRHLFQWAGDDLCCALGHRREKSSSTRTALC